MKQISSGTKNNLENEEKEEQYDIAIIKCHDIGTAQIPIKPPAANFETAVTATKFGIFNVMLIVVAFPAIWSSIFESNNLAYVLPAAQCDLQLSLEDKGFLTGIAYVGMICSGIVWGFLFDSFGRRKLICFGLLLDAAFVIIASLANSKAHLFILKFLGGFVVNGPLSALMTYLSEFHCAKHRGRIQMVVGFIIGSGNVMLSLLAWAILSKHWYFTVFYHFEMHSWNIYILVTAMAPLFSGLIFCFLPESPKFLMTIGRNDKALKVFRNVHKWNTILKPENYPIRKLEEEPPKLSKDRDTLQTLKEGWHNFTPLFQYPFLSNIILVCTLELLSTMGLNTMRLWLPQIFQAIGDYKLQHNNTISNLCSMLGYVQPPKIDDKCIINVDDTAVYTDSLIVNSTNMLSYLLAGILINAIGKKKLLAGLGVISGCCAFTLYFSASIFTTLLFSAVYVAASSIATNVLITIIIDLFPTTLRAITVSMGMMLGRIGGIFGGFLFPMLIQVGCAPPFIFLGSILVLCVILSFFLPDTDQKDLI